ncbi:hypothetical protein CFC21_044629 [Triticum aestivum]|uniref:Serpin domain-containing protein n=2 Tax=Triticum aestivum TaxID=4565 RepID=A0A3B6FYA5_WHEAT|nr:serpin-Z2A-like [Triticum aestivum]KAF7033546.1 hypothetical protein CFC21_044629 [Triticum aestivum]
MGDQEAEWLSKKAGGSSPPPAMGSDSLTAFALRLAKKLAEGDDTRGSNIAFSPLSLYTTLGLVAAGARNRTLDELLALLGAASPDELAGFVRGLPADPSGSGGPVITYAYGVFHQKHMELTPDFLHTATESYNAEIRAVDFAEEEVREETRKEINQWAVAVTNNLISEILPEGSLTDLSRFVLTNAIYFKGVWETGFPKSHTEEHKFHRLDGADPVNVPFMTLPGTCELFVSYNEGFKVLKLPYKAGEDAMSRYSMCVFLPDEDNGLHAMLSTLEEVGGSLLDHVPKHRRRVRELMLPKFKMSFFCRLAQVLRGLGLREAFTEEAADLSGIVEKSVCDVRLDEVFHKAVIEVNEEGTVAAACAAVISRKKKSAMRLEFIADHPFAFYIVQEVSGAVVFAGHVLDPSSSQ